MYAVSFLQTYVWSDKKSGSKIAQVWRKHESRQILHAITCFIPDPGTVIAECIWLYSIK